MAPTPKPKPVKNHVMTGGRRRKEEVAPAIESNVKNVKGEVNDETILKNVLTGSSSDRSSPENQGSTESYSRGGSHHGNGPLDSRDLDDESSLQQPSVYTSSTEGGECVEIS
jgi:hypothetical protein